MHSGARPIGTSDNSPDKRVQAIHKWLQNFEDLAGANLVPASSDASFRRYFRARKGNLCRIVMDAPPDKEHSEPFVRIASWLQEMNLNATTVVAADLEQGFLLLTDLGSTEYLEVLQQTPSRSDDLYADAIDALITMQREGARFQAKLPKFDEALIREELALFSDWLCGEHLEIHFSAEESQGWRSTRDFLIRNALDQPQVFVHRDYHSRHLMLANGRFPNNPGILDFQDAVSGPYTYDLVSLLKDCYVAWPSEKVLAWAQRFFRERQDELGTKIDDDLFLHHFEIMGVQRQLKAAGIFARLNLRDQKPAFMRDIPRTLNYVMEIASRYDELAFLRRLIGERVLPGLQEPTA